MVLSATATASARPVAAAGRALPIDVSGLSRPALPSAVPDVAAGGQSGDWAAQSGVLKDALERGEGRVEFVELTHQYFHLSSWLASPDLATGEDDLADNLAVRGCP